MTRTNIRVLLAAGDATVSARLGNALEIAGFEVTVVARGAEVIRFVARTAPDIFVCDTDLPDADAIQLARRLRRQSAPFPVIILADGPLELELSCKDRATNTVLNPPLIPAPCDEQRLVELISELVADLRASGVTISGFPTRVIWPTARRRAALLAR